MEARASVMALESRIASAAFSSGERNRSGPTPATSTRSNASSAPVAADGPQDGEGGNMVDADAEVFPTLSGMVADKEEILTAD